MSELPFGEEFRKKLEMLRIITARASGSAREGLRRGTKKGGPIEFHDHREYSPGEDLRRIDWNVYGRTEKLFVKEFAKEEEGNVCVLVDLSASMAYGAPGKALYAKRVAAALAYVALAAGDTLSVAAYAEDLGAGLPERIGQGEIYSVIDFLEKLVPGGKTSLGGAMRRFLSTTRRRGALMVISDVWESEEFLREIRPIKARGFDIVLIHVLSPQEENPPAEGNLRLRDSETPGEEMDLFVGRREIDRYRRELAARHDLLRGFCHNHGINYIFTTTDVPFEELILGPLRRSGVLA